MVVAATLLSFSVGLLLGFVQFRRASRRIGPTWEEWRHAEQIGGRRKSLIRAGAGAATAIGLYGFGTPPALRAALLGGVLDERRYCAEARKGLNRRREVLGVVPAPVGRRGHAVDLVL